jgi:glucoamylase
MFVRTPPVVLGLLATIVSAQWPQNVGVDSFVARERGIALQGALSNIGPNGSLVAGAGAGFFVASPSKANPNCERTWSSSPKVLSARADLLFV